MKKQCFKEISRYRSSQLNIWRSLLSWDSIYIFLSYISCDKKNIETETLYSFILSFKFESSLCIETSSLLLYKKLSWANAFSNWKKISKLKIKKRSRYFLITSHKQISRIRRHLIYSKKISFIYEINICSQDLLNILSIMFGFQIYKIIALFYHSSSLNWRLPKDTSVKTLRILQ